MKITLLILVVALIKIMANGQVTNGLVAKYSFNNGNANDEAGTNNGIVNGATLTADRFGNANKAYYFNALNQNSILIPNNTAIDFTNSGDFSITFWMKNSIENGYSGPLVKSQSNGSQNGYGFMCNNSDPGYCNGNGTFFFYTASGPQQDACADSLISNNVTTWMFITGIFDATNQLSFLFVNSIMQSDIGGVGNMTGILSNPEDLYIGGFVSANLFYSGAIDDVRFYNRMLTQVEIDSLYNEPDPATIKINEIPFDKYIIEFYPNPAMNTIYFSAFTNVQLTNITGQVIADKKNINVIDISEQQTGIYFITISDNIGQIIKRGKIMKE